MKHILTLLILLTLSNLIFGQKVYQADRKAYRSNKFSYKFYLFKDSTCFLKGHYPDNSVYFLYKGHLKMRNDTLYEFKFQPVVDFGCNKRFRTGDSVRFNITQKDTTISSLAYKVKTHGGSEILIQLKLGWTSTTQAPFRLMIW